VPVDDRGFDRWFTTCCFLCFCQSALLLLLLLLLLVLLWLAT
jgi:hypothetical protein